MTLFLFLISIEKFSPNCKKLNVFRNRTGNKSTNHLSRRTESEKNLPEVGKLLGSIIY